VPAGRPRPSGHVTTPYAEFRQTGRRFPQSAHIDPSARQPIAMKYGAAAHSAGLRAHLRWAVTFRGNGQPGRGVAAALPPGRILRACRRRHESAVLAVF
jgi:hypothetical protein